MKKASCSFLLTAMYYDLNVPWPSQFRAAGPSHKGPRRKDKKEGPATQTPVKHAPDALEGTSLIQREKMRAVTVDLGECACVGGKSEKQETADTSPAVGYGTVAYNHVVESKFDPARHKNPFASPLQPTQSLPPFPELDPEHASPTQREAVQIRQLSRMTLILDEDSVGKGGHGMTAPSSASLLSYDLLAAQPFNDASFSLLCLTLSELKPNSVDIISLDLSSSARLPFFLKRSTVNAALANGVVFEICYSKVVSRGDGEDQSRIRRNIISAARDILRITDGKGVIFSSGAADVLGLRGPQDVINL